MYTNTSRAGCVYEKAALNGSGLLYLMGMLAPSLRRVYRLSNGFQHSHP